MYVWSHTIIITIIIMNGTLARSLELVVTEWKEHAIHTQTQVVASRNIARVWINRVRLPILLVVIWSVFCVFSSHLFSTSSLFGFTSRSHTGGRSYRIYHPRSFCDACLFLSREKDSAVPFPRRSWSRILCVVCVCVFSSHSFWTSSSLDCVLTI